MSIPRYILFLLVAALLFAATGCGSLGLVTTARFDEYQKAQSEKDDAIGRADRSFALGTIDEQEHAALVRMAQEKPDAVVEKAKKDPTVLDQWGDFALAVGTTLGVPGAITTIGAIALDKIRDKRRRKRGEPVDTDGDGSPDATDPEPLNPSVKSQPEA